MIAGAEVRGQVSILNLLLPLASPGSLLHMAARLQCSLSLPRPASQLRYDQAKNTSSLKFCLAGVKSSRHGLGHLENTHKVVGADAFFDTSCAVPCFAWTLTEPDLNLTLAFSLLMYTQTLCTFGRIPSCQQAECSFVLGVLY